MARKEDLLAGFERAYDDARKKECEELQNALADVITSHHASLQNALFVIELIKFQLLEAKYKEVLGFVKLSDKPPLAIKKKE